MRRSARWKINENKMPLSNCYYICLIRESWRPELYLFLSCIPLSFHLPMQRLKAFVLLLLLPFFFFFNLEITKKKEKKWSVNHAVSVTYTRFRKSFCANSTGCWCHCRVAAVAAAATNSFVCDIIIIIIADSSHCLRHSSQTLVNFVVFSPIFFALSLLVPLLCRWFFFLARRRDFIRYSQQFIVTLRNRIAIVNSTKPNRDTHTWLCLVHMN